MSNLSPRQRQRRDADALIAKLQECESEAHRLGFILTGHAVNKAKNQAGWELAEQITKPMSAR